VVGRGERARRGETQNARRGGLGFTRKKKTQAAPPATASAYALALPLPPSSPSSSLTLAARRSPSSPWLPVAALVVVGGNHSEGGPPVVRLDIPAWPWAGAWGPLSGGVALGGVLGAAAAWLTAWRVAVRAWGGGGPTVWARVGSRLEKVG
jgi:hypothetical protein